MGSVISPATGHPTGRLQPSGLLLSVSGTEWCSCVFAEERGQELSLSFFWVCAWERRPSSPHHSRPCVSSKDSFPPSSCLCSDRLTSSSTELKSFENSSSPVPPCQFCVASALLSSHAARDSDLHHAHLSPYLCFLYLPSLCSHCHHLPLPAASPTALSSSS